MMKSWPLILFLLAVSCGPGKPSAPRKLTREFPAMEIPVMLTEPQERGEWLGQHFWDRFTAPDSLYFCDSLTVNGVPKEDLEKQMSVFATLLQRLPLQDGARAMTTLFSRLDAFQTARPGGNVFAETSALVSRYFYDPNSPFRSEDLYLPFVEKLAVSAHTPESMRMAYQWDARMCALNRIGTKAADFQFIDTAGKRRTLYGIRARYTLLVFGNPDCHACKELVVQLEEDPVARRLVADSSLKVVDIYIDEDIPLWKERMESYPSAWINGYDPTFTIRENLVYNVRALPSLYLLDADKTVLLKDALPEQVLAYLQQ